MFCCTHHPQLTKTMKTRIIKYVALGLLGLVLACKDKAEPQPDWTSAFVGTYYINSSLEDGSPPPQSSQIIATFTVEKIDNQSAMLIFTGKPCKMRDFRYSNTTYDAQATFRFNQVCHTTSTSTLAIRKSIVSGNDSKVVVQFDSLVMRKAQDKYYPECYFSSFPGKIYPNQTFVEANRFLDYPVKEGANLVGFIPSKEPIGSARFFVLSHATSYDWEFGDGNLLKNAADDVVHFYKENGQYEVTVTAKFPSGRTVSTKATINVKGMR
jgi:hypothetical protein